MNKSHIRELFKVNLLYTNPSLTKKLRKKGGRIVSKILFEYLFLGIIFMLLYGLMMVSIDFPNYPGYFTFYIGIFTILSFSQSISSLYNVFYDSNDLDNYLPLPFHQNDVFFSKFLSISLTTLPYLLPILVLFLLMGIKSDNNLLAEILLSLLLFFCIFLLILEVTTLIVAGLTKTKLFSRHKSIITTLLLLIPTVGMVLGIFYLNTKQESVYDTGQKLADQAVFLPLLPFFHVLHSPLTLSSLMTILALLILLFVLFSLIRYWVIPNLYNASVGSGSQSLHTVSQKRRTEIPDEGLDRQLFRYHLKLIKNPTLLTQFISSTVLMPILMLFPMIFNRSFSLSFVPLKFWMVLFLVGIVLANMTINPNSLVSSIISLDRANFLFFRSLPLSMKYYLTKKFQFSIFIQITLSSLLLLALSFFSHLPLALWPFLMIGHIGGSIVTSMYYFYRDYRLLNLNWTNVTQLFSRGNGNFMIFLSLFATLFIGGIAIGLLSLIISFVSAFISLMISILILFLLIFIFFIMRHHYQKNFWDKL